MKVELLYFDGCPSWRHALEALRAVLSEPQDIGLVRVESDEDAAHKCFAGSPTLRVDGVDLFPPGHTDYALGCRIYATPDGLRGWPTAAMIRAALEARSR